MHSVSGIITLNKPYYYVAEQNLAEADTYEFYH